MTDWSIDTLNRPGSGALPDEAPHEVYQRIISKDAIRAPETIGSSLPGDLTPRVAMRMPVGDPKTFFGLIGALARYFDPDHGIACLHDGMHDAFDGIGQRGHAIPHVAPQMIFNGDAADVGKALVDLEVAAVQREEGEADRRRVVNQL